MIVDELEELVRSPASRPLSRRRHAPVELTVADSRGRACSSRRAKARPPGATARQSSSPSTPRRCPAGCAVLDLLGRRVAARPARSSTRCASSAASAVSASSRGRGVRRRPGLTAARPTFTRDPTIASVVDADRLRHHGRGGRGRHAPRSLAAPTAGTASHCELDPRLRRRRSTQFVRRLELDPRRHAARARTGWHPRHAGRMGRSRHRRCHVPRDAHSRPKKPRGSSGGGGSPRSTASARGGAWPSIRRPPHSSAVASRGCESSRRPAAVPPPWRRAHPGTCRTGDAGRRNRLDVYCHPARPSGGAAS